MLFGLQKPQTLRSVPFVFTVLLQNHAVSLRGTVAIVLFHGGVLYYQVATQPLSDEIQRDAAPHWTLLPSGGEQISVIKSERLQLYSRFHFSTIED